MGKSYQNGYLSVPSVGNGAGVLVLHPWWGLNDFIRSFCDRLAQEGYMVFAPDMFSGKIARTIEEAEALIGQSSEEKVVPGLLFSAVDTLTKHPGVNQKELGVVGFSFGGYWALWLAAKKPELFRAVTIFYSSGEGDFRQSKAAFQGHFAETDQYEPEEGIKELEKNLKGAKRPTTFYTYPGTGHWFFEKDRTDAYDAQAAQLAWERTTAFLHENLES
jgi:carboxymethylenebutenolidase